MRHPLRSNCRVRNECDITKIESTAIAVVTSVRRDVDHESRRFDLLAYNRESAISLTAVTSSEGTLIIVDVRPLSFSSDALRAFKGFQLLLFSPPPFVATGLLSILFRRSRTEIISLFEF